MPDSGERQAPGRGRPRTVVAEERRRRILQAARGVFTEAGFARTTTAAVAARAHVSKRSIYEVFAGKTGLFAAVIADQPQLFLDLPRPAGEKLPLLDTLVRIFRLDLDEETERVREAMLHLIIRESVQFPELSDYLYEHEIIHSREMLIGWLETVHADGLLRVTDPSLRAGMLMDIVFGTLLPRRRLCRPVDRAARREEIVRRMDIVLRGMHDF